MEIAYIIISSVVSAALLAVIVTRIVGILIQRTTTTRVKPRSYISREMRDEIEQNGRWWDRQFHLLLFSVGAPDECPCQDCTWRKMGLDEVQRHLFSLGYEFPIDGITGPLTQNAVSSISKGGTTVIYNQPPEMYTGDFALDVQIRRAMKLPARRYWG